MTCRNSILFFDNTSLKFNLLVNQRECKVLSRVTIKTFSIKKYVKTNKIIPLWESELRKSVHFILNKCQ